MHLENFDKFPIKSTAQMICQKYFLKSLEILTWNIYSNSAVGMTERGQDGHMCGSWQILWVDTYFGNIEFLMRDCVSV